MTRALAGRDRRRRRPPRRGVDVIGELHGDVGVLLRELRQLARCSVFALRVVELRPWVLPAPISRVEQDAGDGAVGHPHARVASGDVDVLRAVGVRADEGEVVDRLQHLARPAVSRSPATGPSLARPLLEALEAHAGVVLVRRLVVLAADDERVAARRRAAAGARSGTGRACPSRARRVTLPSARAARRRSVR